MILQNMPLYLVTNYPANKLIIVQYKESHYIVFCNENET